MKVFVTGNRGFIGQNLIRELEKTGIEAVIPDSTWRLGQKVAPTLLSGVTHAIHLAHESRAQNTESENIQKIPVLVSTLREAGVMFQCYVSSFSASPNATSSYGRTKYSIEQIIAGEDICLLRPGLVVGEGGIWAKIEWFINRFRLAIIPNGSDQLSPSIGVEQLCQDIVKVIIEGKSGVIYSFKSKNQTFKGLVKTEIAGVKFICLSVPSSILKAIFRFFSVLKIRLPISEDNLSGFLTNQKLDLSHLKQIGETLWQAD